MRSRTLELDEEHGTDGGAGQEWEEDGSALLGAAKLDIRMGYRPVTYTLILGQKNYSSWSMRAWLLMKSLGLPFDEVTVPLYRPDSREAVRAPGAVRPGSYPCCSMTAWQSGTPWRFCSGGH